MLMHRTATQTYSAVTRHDCNELVLSGADSDPPGTLDLLLPPPTAAAGSGGATTRLLRHLRPSGIDDELVLNYNIPVCNLQLVAHFPGSTTETEST